MVPGPQMVFNKKGQEYHSVTPECFSWFLILDTRIKVPGKRVIFNNHILGNPYRKHLLHHLS